MWSKPNPNITHISVYLSLGNTNYRFHLQNIIWQTFRHFFYFFSNYCSTSFVNYLDLKYWFVLIGFLFLRNFPVELLPWVLPPSTSHRPGIFISALDSSTLTKISDVARFPYFWTTEVVPGCCFIHQEQIVLWSITSPLLITSHPPILAVALFYCCSQLLWSLLTVADVEPVWRLTAQADGTAQEGLFSGRPPMPVVVVFPHTLDVCAPDPARNPLAQA